MTSTLSPNPEAFLDASWEDIEPLYERLARAPIDNLEAWLSEWSALEAALDEAATLSSVAYTRDTRDPERRERHLRWAGRLGPRVEEQSVRLSRRLLEAGRLPEGLEQAGRRLRNRIDLFRAENLPLMTREAEAKAAFNQVIAEMCVDWDGERLTLPQVRARLGDPDRQVRERAFMAAAQPYIDARDHLAGIFDELRETRQEMAINAGFASYRDYCHQSKHRFDYTPDDCLRWHEAVEAVMVPAALRILERRRRLMGLDRLRPWDVEGDPDPLGRPDLRPAGGGVELAQRAVAAFERVDPALAERFRTMIEADLLDLDSRPGKAPGGYCSTFHHRRLPFIFMNGAGTAGDVRTLFHEAGHAFHAFESLQLPYLWQRRYGSEMAEVASMSMELLAAPHWGPDAAGYFDEAALARARIEHLEGRILFFGHCASVDAFQHWIYTDPAGADPDARDRRWSELRDRFLPGVDWTGLAAQRVARWYQQLHFFLYPFYYIEYGLAQLGALQVWRNSLSDPARAVAAYRSALALGGTCPLSELYAAAGARLIFDPAGMAELVELVETEIDRLGASR